MLRTSLIYILNNSVLFFCALFFFRACLWMAVESLSPARPVAYRQVMTRDIVAEIAHVFIIVPVALYFSNYIFAYPPFPQALQNAPLIFRIALYLLLADFGYYWVHRLMHWWIFWPTHKWHHYPIYMYWLAGCRATVPQQFLVSVPFVVATPVLYPSPWWLAAALVMFSYLTVDWMHLNVLWRAKWLEWFIVTPRFHYIHHSSNPNHYNFNLGNLFTIWDRLFGTYLDPDTVNFDSIELGIGDAPNPVRLIAGV